MHDDIKIGIEVIGDNAFSLLVIPDICFLIEFVYLLIYAISLIFHYQTDKFGFDVIIMKIDILWLLIIETPKNGVQIDIEYLQFLNLVQ